MRMDQWVDRRDCRHHGLRPWGTVAPPGPRPLCLSCPRLADLITVPRTGPAAPHVRWDSTPLTSGLNSRQLAAVT